MLDVPGKHEEKSSSTSLAVPDFLPDICIAVLPSVVQKAGKQCVLRRDPLQDADQGSENEKT